MKTFYSRSQAVKASRLLRVIAITATSLCLAGGVAYAGFALPGPAAQLPTAPPLQRATNPLTWTVFLPLIVTPINVRFSAIGYDCCPLNNCAEICEHIHFKNYGTAAVDITGWKITSAATGDSFVFPKASAPPYSSTLKEMTLTTHYPTNDPYSFNWNINKDEWPSNGGVAYLFDAHDNLISTCHYTPTNNGTGNAPCQ